MHVKVLIPICLVSLAVSTISAASVPKGNAFVDQSKLKQQQPFEWPVKSGGKPPRVIHNSSSKGSKIMRTENVAKNGKKWTVLSHPAFPKHSVRIREDNLEDLCDPTVNQFAGYFDSGDNHLFFWFFESRFDPVYDPLVLWLNGGPGCSSFTGLFMELGPCRVAEGGNSTIFNEWSWNTNANLLFLDQPAEVGFSYSDSPLKVPQTSDEAAVDVYIFLQILLQGWPQYQPLDFHITGESYAGHYIPSIAHEIDVQNDDVLSNDDDDRVYINLASLAIGNGITNALVQFETIPDFLEDTKYGEPLVDPETAAKMRASYPQCARLLEACYRTQSSFICAPAAIYCGSIVNVDTDRNPYDIRQPCPEGASLCYPILNDIETFSNSELVQEILGVDRKFESCKTEIGIRFLIRGDIARPSHLYLPPLLEKGINIMIYVGDADSVCDWIGNKAWTLALEWEGKEEFNNAEDLPWISSDTGKQAGEIRTAGALTFVKVYESGHMVPYDQPEHSNQLINMFIARGI